MRFIIAGGRNFDNYDLLSQTCGQLREQITEIVSGKARGADSLGETWGNENNVPIKSFPANWDLYGKRAGYLRNTEMADYADGLIAFWNGESKGTKHMIDTANNKGLEVHIIKY
jgi:glycerophosphoryl diester phosphodiesterase